MTLLARLFRRITGYPDLDHWRQWRKVPEGSSGCGISPEVISVTGSGRNLVGRLLDSDVIVNEITAQARAALHFDSTVDTVVEIGGQDSKWIALEDGRIKDFEMNRVCAAGTGSFLMAQAQRLNMNMGMEFSEAAFEADKPADLGNRCTVIHGIRPYPPPKQWSVA